MTQQKMMIFGLMLRCPAISGSDRACPLGSIRGNYSEEEKLTIAERLTREEALEILRYHDLCLQQRICRIGHSGV